MAASKPTFFQSPRHFREWLAQNCASHEELWLGFFKKASGNVGISYREALDEALCFGWIDGVRKRLDDERFVQRFTPRKAKSYWSAVNTRRAHELIEGKRMAPPGLAAFEARDPSRTERYSFARAASTFNSEQLKRFKRKKEAWAFFESQTSSYKKLCTFWVVSAKKPDTRAQRLEKLIAACHRGRRLF